MNDIINFELAKLLFSKEFEEPCIFFYSKPRSKMFGIDEKGRVYPIKNIPKNCTNVGNTLLQI